MQREKHYVKEKHYRNNAGLGAPAMRGQVVKWSDASRRVVPVKELAKCNFFLVETVFWVRPLYEFTGKIWYLEVVPLDQPELYAKHRYTINAEWMELVREL